MRLPRAPALAVALVAAIAAALLLVAWLTRAPPPSASSPPAPGTPVRGGAVSQVAPGRTAEPPPCAGPLAEETLRSATFSDAWAMCRLFGNYDAERGTSHLPGAVARVALSTGFTDGTAARRLVVVRRVGLSALGLPDPAVSGSGLTANVFERLDDGWRFATAGEVGDGRAAAPRLELLRVGPARHGLLVEAARPDLATVFGVSELGVPRLLEDVPLGGTNVGDCAPPRCFTWKAEVSFERGRDPDYDDAVFRITGTRPDDDERVWGVNETTRWVRRGGRYLPE